MNLFVVAVILIPVGMIVVGIANGLLDSEGERLFEERLKRIRRSVTGEYNNKADDDFPDLRIPLPCWCGVIHSPVTIIGKEHWK